MTQDGAGAAAPQTVAAGQGAAAATTTTLPVPGFITGQMTRLRPVLDDDLAELARLIAQSVRGFNWRGEACTVQSLRKRFDDDKESGLWGPHDRYFAITDESGALCGVFLEAEHAGRLFLDIHIDNAHPQRDLVGGDALAAYIAYCHSWNGHISRISSSVLEMQVQERQWLLSCGFEWEMRREAAWLYLGEPVSVDSYSWLPPWVAANRAADGIGGAWEGLDAA